MTLRRKILLASSMLLLFAAVLAIAIFQPQPCPEVPLRNFTTKAAAESPQVSLDKTTTNAVLEQHLNQYIEAVGTVDFTHKVDPVLICGDSWLVLETPASLPRGTPGTYLARGTLRAWDVPPQPTSPDLVSASLSPGRYYRLDNAVLIPR